MYQLPHFGHIWLYPTPFSIPSLFCFLPRAARATAELRPPPPLCFAVSSPEREPVGVSARRARVWQRGDRRRCSLVCARSRLLRHSGTGLQMPPLLLLPSVASPPCCCCHLRRAPDLTATRQSPYAAVSCCPPPVRAVDAAFDVCLSGQTHSSVSSSS